MSQQNPKPEEPKPSPSSQPDPNKPTIIEVPPFEEVNYNGPKIVIIDQSIYDLDRSKPGEFLDVS